MWDSAGWLEGLDSGREQGRDVRESRRIRGLDERGTEPWELQGRQEERMEKG